MLAEWTQFNKDGSVFITGTSYARVGEDGRITHLLDLGQLTWGS